LSWGVFAGIAFVGFLLSWGIRGDDLESADWDEDENEDSYDNESSEGGEHLR